MNRASEKKTMRIKRMIALLLLVLTVLSLTSCGKPSGMSDSNYQKCKQLIETYDAYLDFKIDNKVAGDKITAIAATMDDESTVIGSYYTQFAQSIGSFMKAVDNPAKALEDRNSLAEGVGLPKR